MGKLDNWAADLKQNLEFELKDIDIELRELKKEATLASSLEQKLELHRKVKDLEKQRNDKRKNLFEAQDSVDERKDELLKATEARLKQGVEAKRIFEIEWRVV